MTVNFASTVQSATASHEQVFLVGTGHGVDVARDGACFGRAFERGGVK